MAAGLRPDPLGELKVPPGPPPAAFMGEQGNGEATAGRIKGWEDGERTEGREREGNERKERGVVPHPKLNPGCATVMATMIKSPNSATFWFTIALTDVG